jgi:hypothetical protein
MSARTRKILTTWTTLAADTSISSLTERRTMLIQVYSYR